MTFPSPTGPALAREEVFLLYLDYYRERVIEKVSALPLDALVVSVVPTDWTALELVQHLTYVEMRWLEWGFEGQSVADPWGDHVGDHWFVDSEETPESLIDALGEPGPRWEGDAPASLERVLFHLINEYARHLGHLDIYCELADVPGGE